MSNTSEEMLSLIASLNAAIINLHLYTKNHPHVKRYLDRAYLVLTQVLKLRSPLTLILMDDDLVVNNQTLTPHTPHLAQFIDVLKKNAIERLTFTMGITPHELASLVKDLADSEQTIVRSSANIILGKVQVQVKSSLDVADDHLLPETAEKIQELTLLRDRSMDDFKEAYRHIKRLKKVQIETIDAIINKFVEGVGHSINPLHLLASLKRSNEYTFTHAINVCILTMAQAEVLGVKGRRLYDVGIAAALHDVGKMFVPDEILNKPGKLSTKEWHLMHHHATSGARYLMRLEGVSRIAFLGALEHHIRYNGTGYPFLGKKWKPNTVSQMIAVADLFDAMRSRRPYQEPKPDNQILKVLQMEKGISFDPLIVENFLRLIKS